MLRLSHSLSLVDRQRPRGGGDPLANAYLTPDEEFYFTTPDGSQYYQQPA